MITCPPPFPLEQGAQGGLFTFIAMSKLAYTKPALSYLEQLNQLKDRGLLITDEAKTLHLLENISYYRLSGYWYPLLIDKNNHLFKPGSNFETAFLLYCFDRELRALIISELEKIEVSIRAKMIHILSDAHGPFWFNDITLFKDSNKFQKTLSKIHEEYQRSDEEFIKAFKRKYSDPFPPAWMALEITSLGSLSKLFSNLNTPIQKRAIAKFYGLADGVFEKWLHSIVYLRNVCAHHTRLWNRNMSISPQAPKTTTNTWITDKNVRTNKTYFMLCMIRYLLQTVNPNTTFSDRLKQLFAKYPNVDAKAMDFPINWEREPLWL